MNDIRHLMEEGGEFTLVISWPEIGLETATVVGKDGERVQEWLTLPNGCLCCTVKSARCLPSSVFLFFLPVGSCRGDLAVTMEQLAERKDSFDYIFIETTGMADPGPLVNSLWLDQALESSIVLDSIVTIVDAKHFLSQLNSGTSPSGVNEAQRQVRFKGNGKTQTKEKKNPVKTNLLLGGLC